MSLPLHAFTKAIRLAEKFEDRGTVSEAIEQGCGKLFVVKNLGPIPKAQIGGDQERDPFVEGGAQLEDELCAILGQGDEAEFIDDD